MDGCQGRVRYRAPALIIKMMMMMVTLLKSNLFKDKPCCRVGGVLEKKAATRTGVTLVLKRGPR